MPTYEYQCRDCGERMEVFQKFSEKPLRVHPACGGQLQKIFHPSGIVFKGSGYYVTDSRSNSSASSGTNGSNGTGSGSKADKGKTAPKAGSSEQSSKSEGSAGD